MHPSARFVLPAAFLSIAVLWGGAKARRNSPADSEPRPPAGTLIDVPVRTGVTWSADCPSNATVVASWRAHGAYQDLLDVRLDGKAYRIYSQGGVGLPDGSFISLADEPLALLPEAHDPLLPAGRSPSRVWYGTDAFGSHLFTWQNAAANRNPQTPVSVQLEITEAGDLYLRRDDGTERLRYRIREEDLLTDDRDGDGLSTHDELFVHATDPGLTDTDGDGIPDGIEVTDGGDPRVRSVPDEQILARVAASALLTSTKLFDGFAADTAAGVIFERTVPRDPARPWTHHYLSSREDAYAPWHLAGLTLERIDTPEAVTIRLAADAPSVACRTPLYLLPFAPRIAFDADLPEIVSDTTPDDRYVVTASALPLVLPIRIDWSGRPAEGPLTAEETALPGLREIAAATGGRVAYTGDERGGELTVSAPGVYALPDGGGHRFLVVLDPFLAYGSEHEFRSTSVAYDPDSDTYSVSRPWPFDNACLRTIRADGSSDLADVCTCTPVFRTGLDGDAPAWLDSTVSADEQTARAEIRICGQRVWHAQVPHRPIGRAWTTARRDSKALSAIGECTACRSDSCPEGTCGILDEVAVDPLRFRLPLGVDARRRITGFLAFSLDTPSPITPELFEQHDRTPGLTHRYSVTIDGLTDDGPDAGSGVRLTVTNAISGQLEHVWEISRAANDAGAVRFRKINRQGSVLSDRTARQADDGSWSLADNISGLVEISRHEDHLNDPDDNRLYEWREQRVGTNVLSAVYSESQLIGTRDHAVLRETMRREETGCATHFRHAEYWDDPAHPLRHGLLRCVYGDDINWAYHTYDDNGLETAAWYPNGGVSSLDLQNAMRRSYTYDPDEPTRRTATVSLISEGVNTVASVREDRLVTDLPEARTTNEASDDNGNETRLYDDKGRLVSIRYPDGTWTTNAYSCCRLLWWRERDGKVRLRSAVTGRDRLYYAIEEAWEAEVSSNATHTVTQHFMDALGRETNCTTYVATELGEATNHLASVGKEILFRMETEYPSGGPEYVVRRLSDGTRLETRTFSTSNEVIEETTSYANADSTQPTTVSRTITPRGGTPRFEDLTPPGISPRIFDSPETKNTLIPLIPQIFRKNGWPKAEALMNRWLNGPANTNLRAVPPCTDVITLAWLRSDYPSAYDHVRTLASINYRSIPFLKECIRLKYLRSEDFARRFCGDEPSVVPILGDTFHHVLFDNYTIVNSFNELNASLGRFSFFIIFSGYEWENCLTCTRVGVFAMDNFEFNDPPGHFSQFLGFWDLDNLEGPTYDPRDIWLTNEDFRTYRATTGHGMDYTIFSDIKWFPIAPFSFSLY